MIFCVVQTPLRPYGGRLGPYRTVPKSKISKTTKLFSRIRIPHMSHIQACISHVSVYLTGVYLMGVHLTGVYLMGVHLTGVHLTGVHLTGVHLTGVHLTGMHLTGMHLMSMCLIGVIGVYLTL
jgi:Pentapeptide repeats (8 copies)